MRRLSLGRRVVLSAVAIVQMAVPAFAAIADARIVADSGGTPQVHVEDHTQKGCHRVHPDDCALCQLLTHLSAPRGSAPALPVAAASCRAPNQAAGRLPAAVARAQKRSRAPPVSLT